MAFTTQSLSHAKEMLERAQARMKTLREHSEYVLDEAFTLAETSGAAIGFGMMNGAWGTPEHGDIRVLGLPLELIAGAGLHLVAFGGGLGKYAEHGHNVANGALAAYGYRLGHELGASWAADKDKQQAQGAGASATSAQGQQPQAVPASAPLPAGPAFPNGAAVPQGARFYTVHAPA